MPKGKPRKKDETRIRQQGTGSVYWNKAKSRYQATIEMDPDAEGNRVRKTYTARLKGQTTEAKAECENQLADWQADYHAGTLRAPSRETVQGYLEEWAQTKAALKWGERMAVEVPRQLELYVYPVIGTLRLNVLDASDIKKVLARMARKVSKRTGRVLSRQMQLHVYRTLHSALGNRIPWDEVDTPTVKRRNTTLPSSDVISRLLTAATEVQHGLVFVLMGTLGTRPQEVLGLRRSDLDFDRNAISVNEVMVTRGPVRFKETKTEESRRTLEVPPEVMDLLRAYCEERVALQLRAGRVFVTDAGLPLTLHQLYAPWRRLLAAQGVPYFRPYDLRHFAASFWLYEGLPLAMVSAALGHSTQATTARIYSHLLRGRESRIAQTSGKLLKLEKKRLQEAE